jgi:hypothetical protein
MSPTTSIRQEGEQGIRHLEQLPRFLVGVFDTLVATEDPTLRLAVAILLKNKLKSHWTARDMTAEQTDYIRRSLPPFALTVSEARVQDTLVEAIRFLYVKANREWDDLIGFLVQGIQSGSPAQVRGGLLTLRMLCTPFSLTAKSDKLWLEIKRIIDLVGATLTTYVTMYTDDSILQEPTALKENEANLCAAMDIFFLLNVQDLPAYFEDNMASWMNAFRTYLTHPGTPRGLRLSILRCVDLYVSKYAADARGYLPQLILVTMELTMQETAMCGEELVIWEHQTTAPARKTFFEQHEEDVAAAISAAGDDLDSGLDPICRGLSILTNALKVGYILTSGDVFNAAAIQTYSDALIVPNIKSTAADYELFLYEPNVYVERECEGSAIVTKRSAARRFLRELMQHWNDEVTECIMSHVMTFANWGETENKWELVHTSMELFSSIAVSSKTVSSGAKNINPKVDISSYYTRYIMKYLLSPADQQQQHHPMLISSAINFVMLFRQYMDKSMARIVVGCLNSLSPDFSPEALVSFTYLLVETTLHLVPVDELPNFLVAIAEHLMRVVGNAGQGDEPDRNEYIVRAVYRLLLFMFTRKHADRRNAMLNALPEQSLAFLLARLTWYLSRETSSFTPTRSAFIYYVFECLGVISRLPMPSFKEQIFESMKKILVADSAAEYGLLEFQGYIYQILGAMSEQQQPYGPSELHAFLIAQMHPDSSFWAGVKEGHRPRGSVAPYILLFLRLIASPQFQQECTSEMTINFLKVVELLLFLPSSNYDLEGFQLLLGITRHLLPLVLPLLPSIYQLLHQYKQKDRASDSQLPSLYIMWFYSAFAGQTHHLMEAASCLKQNVAVDIQTELTSIAKVTKPGPSNNAGHLGSTLSPIIHKTITIGMAAILTNPTFFQYYSASHWCAILEQYVAFMGNSPGKAMHFLRRHLASEEEEDENDAACIMSLTFSAATLSLWPSEAFSLQGNEPIQYYKDFAARRLTSFAQEAGITLPGYAQLWIRSMTSPPGTSAPAIAAPSSSTWCKDGSACKKLTGTGSCPYMHAASDIPCRHGSACVYSATQQCKFKH